VADDGLTSTPSSIWSFTTYSDSPIWDEIPTNQTINFGDDFYYDLNASDLSGIASWSINDSTNFKIDGNGIVTNKVSLAVGQYWLEVEAFDPYGNGCSCIFKLTVLESTGPGKISDGGGGDGKKKVSEDISLLMIGSIVAVSMGGAVAVIAVILIKKPFKRLKS